MANMSSRPQVAYKFGDFLLNPADKQLLRNGKPVALPPKVFDALLLLVESQAHLVEKDDFLKPTDSSQPWRSFPLHLARLRTR